MFREKVLIVNGNKPICLAMKEELIRGGYTFVENSFNGEEAVEKVKLRKYDIVFLDIILPGINGIKTSQLIKKVSSDTKIIFMCGKVGAELIKEDLRSSIQGNRVIFLYKPFKRDEIFNTIDELSKQRTFVYTHKNKVKSGYLTNSCTHHKEDQ